MQEDNIYRKKECELCGKYAFEKFIKTTATLDGGFTKVQEWEKSGFGSLVTVFYNIGDLKNSRNEFKLCPDCARQIDLAIYNKVQELKKKYTESESKYLTPSDVRKMSPTEVKKNYDLIIESMKRWGPESEDTK